LANQNKALSDTSFIRKQLTLLEQMIDSIPEPFFAIDLQGKVIAWNKAVEELTCIKKIDMLGKGDYEYSLPFYGTKRPLLLNLVLKNDTLWESTYTMFERKGDTLTAEGYSPFPKNGLGMYFWSFASPVRNKNNEIIGAVQSIRDIKELKLNNVELKELTLKDSLTGCYNAAYLEEELVRLQKSRSYPITILTCDIDNFKSINESFGYSFSNELLTTVSELLLSCIREADMLARIRGDEFVITLPYTDTNAAETIFKRITKCFDNYNEKADFPINLSIGYSTASDNSNSLKEVFKASDFAMYLNKYEKKLQRKGGFDKSKILRLFDNMTRSNTTPIEIKSLAEKVLLLSINQFEALGGTLKITDPEYLSNPFTKKISISIDSDSSKLAVSTNSKEDIEKSKNKKVRIPLLANEKSIGELILNTKKVNPFSFSDENILKKSIGNLLGQSFHDSLLQHRKQLKARMFEKIASVTQELSKSISDSKSFDRTLDQVKEYMNTKWCILRMLDKQTGEMLLVGSSGISTTSKAKIARLDPRHCLLGEVLKTAKTISVKDIRNAPPNYSLPYYASQMRSVAIAPVISANEVIGTLKVYSDKVRIWSEDEIEFLTSMAEILGLSFTNIHLRTYTKNQSLKVVYSLSSALESKDRYTKGHSERTAQIAYECASRMKIDSETMDLLWIASTIHDIGKIGVPEGILLKPGGLVPSEFEIIKNHAVDGAKIIEEGGLPEIVVNAVRYHHENWDGSGYPNHLKKNEIPLMARIIRIADSFDAMTSDRPYRKAMSVKEAYSILEQGKGKLFDPDIVDIFLRSKLFS